MAWALQLQPRRIQGRRKPIGKRKGCEKAEGLPQGLAGGGRFHAFWQAIVNYPRSQRPELSILPSAAPDHKKAMPPPEARLGLPGKTHARSRRENQLSGAG